MDQNIINILNETFGSADDESAETPREMITLQPDSIVAAPANEVPAVEIHQAEWVDNMLISKTQETPDKQAETSPVNGEKGGRPKRAKVDFRLAAISFLRYTVVNYKYYRGEWYRFNGKFYYRVMENDVRNHVVIYIHLHPEMGLRAVMQDVKNLMLNIAALGAVESTRSMPCWLNSEEHDDKDDDAKNWIITKNVIVNVVAWVKRLNGEDIPDEQIFQPHTPDLFSTIAVDYEYRPDAECPMFMQYLRQVQSEEQDREIIQMMLGLALIPDTSYEVIFILYGQGGTGKSVCLAILQALVSARNVCCLPLSKFDETHEVHLLAENLLNIVGDMPTASGHSSLHHIEGILKDVASGGLLNVNKKYLEPYSAKAIARNIFATNSLPPFADRSNGIWDRLRIIPFNQVFRGTENQNPHLARDIIKTEMPGIFKWAVEGLAKLKQLTQFPHSERGAQLAAEHRRNCDHESEFIRENYVESPDSYIVANIIYHDYQTFCRENGYRAKNAANFHNALRNCFPEITRDKKRFSGQELSDLFDQCQARSIGVNSRPYVFIGIDYKR